MANGAAIPLRKTENEAARVREAIDDFVDAFQAKNLERIVSHYAPNVVAFDLMPPLRHVGIEAWRKVWEDTLPMMQGEITIEFQDLSIDVVGNMATAHALSHFVMDAGGAEGGDDEMDIWMRWSAVFQNIAGQWLITHEHNSVPIDMEGGKALLELRP